MLWEESVSMISISVLPLLIMTLFYNTLFTLCNFYELGMQKVVCL